MARSFVLSLTGFTYRRYGYTPTSFIPALEQVYSGGDVGSERA